MPTEPALLSTDVLESAALAAEAPPYGLLGVPSLSRKEIAGLVATANVSSVLQSKLGRCAVVGSSGLLLESSDASAVAAAIDDHDAVLRFNDAPTRGFEQYVGARTTHRIVHRDSLDAGVAQPAANATQLVYMSHHGSDFGAHGQRAAEAGEVNHTNMIGALVAHGAWIINPAHIAQTRSQLLHTTAFLPSSGFEGIALALSLCDGPVDLYGYGAAARCGRYYGACTDSGATYVASGGSYHAFETEAEVRDQLAEMGLVRVHGALEATPSLRTAGKAAGAAKGH